jgi:hypothetical protein
MTKKPDGPIGVFVATFDSEKTADKALKAIRFLQDKTLMLDIYEDALVHRDPGGKVHVKEARGGRHGAKIGATAGVVLGTDLPTEHHRQRRGGSGRGRSSGKPQTSADGQELPRGCGGPDQARADRDHRHHRPSVHGVIQGGAPSAVYTFSHAFASADADSIREWLSSIRADAEAAGVVEPEGAE